MLSGKKYTMWPGALLVCLFVSPLFMPAFAHSAIPPAFELSFSPDTIGPGSIATLNYTITNYDPSNPVGELAFTNDLPIGVTIASPGGVVSDCSGKVTALDGGGTMALSGGGVGMSGSCTISVDVTSSTPGTHTNTTGDLTSDMGNSGPASGDLIVATDRPGFTKSFAPETVSLGDRSTLTFTINNSLNPTASTFLSFADNLPAGMVVANPANLSTDCGADNPAYGTLTALPGENVISYIYSGYVNLFDGVEASSSCTVTVDVQTTGAGELGNTTGDLNTSNGTSGSAGAVLNVTADLVHLTTSFEDDPVVPGGTVTLEFVISNADRNFSATGISFTDDLGATLSVLTFSNLLENSCGGTVSGIGTTVIDFAGGVLGPEGTCTIRAELNLSPGSSSGQYVNTTSQLTGLLDGLGFTSSPASDVLFVNEAPTLKKSFLVNPVAAGDTTTIEFIITNTSTTSGATDITFVDELTTFMPFPVSVNLPPGGFCGPGASASLISLDVDRQGLLITGGSLAAAGTVGDSCTFTIDVDIPNDMPSGTYVNTTEPVTASVNGSTNTGKAASDSLTIAGAPQLIKIFTDDPVVPGGTVTLEYTLLHDAQAAGNATAISFTDDLTLTLAGLVAIGLPLNDVCGTGSQVSGTSNLSFTGGTLIPGGSCTFSVTLQIPGPSSPGIYKSSSGNVSATVIGLSTTGNSASDDLFVGGLAISASFTDDPVIPGDTVNLEFTISNLSTTTDATSISFSDSLSSVLSGLTTIGGVDPDPPCGAGSSLTGSTFLTLTGGNLASEESCTFSVTLQVPVSAVSGTFVNVTSSLSALSGGSFTTVNPAADELVIDKNLLHLAKSFTNDPVASGDSVSLEFVLSNLHTTQQASAISFSDDLHAILPGLIVTGLPQAACGGMIETSDSGKTLDFTGGVLDAGATCTFSVDLQVPSGVAAGTVATNTTSSVSGLINGLAVTGYPATDDLQVGIVFYDRDKDGISDQFDNCPFVANPEQENYDGDSQGDICDPDDDNDTVPDTLDNCRFAVNTGQENYDNDPWGNTCDRDDDNDGIPDYWENELGLNPFDSSDAAEDYDGDGFTNYEEYLFFTDPYVFNIDKNENGVPDRTESLRGMVLAIWHLLNPVKK